MDIATLMTAKPNLHQAMIERHSVRRYADKPLPESIIADLRQAIDLLNEDHFTDMQLVVDEPHSFSGIKAKYGRFSGVKNYIALVGPECDELQEVLGYAGEKLVLYAQALGLNTCWAGSSYRQTNRVYRVAYGYMLAGMIAIGYGETQGEPHESVAPEVVAPQYDEAPDWFRAGVDAALLAPTAHNQQKFRFELMSEAGDGLSNGMPDGIAVVTARAKRGPFSQMDLGIAKLHFELGAGPDSFEWGE